MPRNVILILTAFPASAQPRAGDTSSEAVWVAPGLDYRIAALPWVDTNRLIRDGTNPADPWAGFGGLLGAGWKVAPEIAFGSPRWIIGPGLDTGIRPLTTEVSIQFARELAARIAYRLRKPWNDGTHTLEFDPLVFLDRLAALVPPPRANLVTYHGVLASHAARREAVVRQASLGSTAAPAGRRPWACDPPVLEAAGGTTATRVRRRRERDSWATLLMRVFALDILRCPCGARREIIAMITDPPVIRAILECLHLDPDEVVTDPARGPP